MDKDAKVTKENQPGETEGAGKNMDRSRRKALLKLGRYGAYTAPALLAMLTSAQASIVPSNN